MESVNIRQAREKFRELIDSAERGESIAITRRGKRVAILSPSPSVEETGLPDLSEFRASLSASMAALSLSNAVLELRETERY